MYVAAQTSVRPIVYGAIEPLAAQLINEFDTAIAGIEAISASKRSALASHPSDNDTTEQIAKIIEVRALTSPK